MRSDITLSAMLSLLVAAASPAVAAGPAVRSDVPRYEVDASWPSELPGNWIMGQVGGVAIDAQDHVWVLQRPRSLTDDEIGATKLPPRSECCVPAPSVIEFDADGHVLRSWGGPGFVPDWPSSEHALAIDRAGNVWISGNGADDRAVLKFSADGRLMLEIGTKSLAPKDNRDTTLLGRVADISVDDAAHEVYIADGYLNNRVVVYDSDSGAFRRGWGAYGIALADIVNSVEQPEKDIATAGLRPAYAPGGAPDPQFRSPVHCVRLSADGLVYVCDRHNDRIQVFTKAGRFLREFSVRPATLGNGSTWTVAFSHDRAQKYLLVGDGENNVVWILDRASGATVSGFGHFGRNAGQFHWVHQVAMDSKGNLYTGEVGSGERLQKFRLRGR